MASLGEAFEKVRADPTLAKEFSQDPAGVMKRLGVDTSHLKVTKNVSVPHAAAGAADISGCVSIGCIVCGSIG